MCLVFICLIVAVQVAGRITDAVTVTVFGSSYGFHVPSAAEFSGFLFAASSFLALACTFRRGGHIRVFLLLSRWSASVRLRIEIGCLVFAAGLSGFSAFHAFLLALDSLLFGEMSVGIVPVPLWIPQGFMALGLVVLTISVLDDLICVLAGGEPSYREFEGTPDENINSPGAGSSLRRKGWN